MCTRSEDRAYGVDLGLQERALKQAKARVDQLLVLGMGNLQPLIGNPYNGYINPYYWVDDHPLLYGNNGSLDPSTYTDILFAVSQYTLKNIRQCGI